MESTFRLTALGIQPGQDPQTVRVQLQSLLKGNPSVFQDAFHRISLNQRVVLGEQIPQAQAQTLLQKFTAIGLKCRLDPMALSLVPMEEDDKQELYQCPACGHRQPPAANNALDICERCGIVGRNYAEINELKQAIDLERRRIKSQMSQEEEQEEREKARQRQEKLRAMAKRQVEREMGITTADKIKALLAPRTLFPVLGSMTAAAAGIGLLVWQLQGDKPAVDSASTNAGKPGGLQLTINAPGAAINVQNPGSQAGAAKSQVAQNSAGVSASATKAAGAATPGDTSSDAGAAKPQVALNSAVPPGSAAEPAASDVPLSASAGKPASGSAAAVPEGVGSDAGVTKLQVGQNSAEVLASAAQAATSDAPLSASAGAAAGRATGPDVGAAKVVTASSDSATPPAKPAPLLDVSKLALAPPAAGAAGVAGKTRPAGPDPQLLADLARYQTETGDLTAAIRSVDRASELLGAKRGSMSDSDLDAFNRAQVEIRAGIARQFRQRQELATAQTHLFRATHLANSIKTPYERSQALSSLARTLYDGQTSTARDYFNRAIETAQLVKEPVEQVIVLSAIARDLTGASRIEQTQDWFGQAASIATTLQKPEDRLIARAVLAKHRAEAGDTAAAKTLLSEIIREVESGVKTPPELGQHQAEAFSALALSQATHGEIDTARTDFAAALHQTQALADPEMRAETLLYLAQDIAAAGDLEAAAKLVAAAGPWDDSPTAPEAVKPHPDEAKR